MTDKQKYDKINRIEGEGEGRTGEIWRERVNQKEEGRKRTGYEHGRVGKRERE